MVFDNHQTMETAMTNPSTPPKNILTTDVEIKGSLKFSGDLLLDGKLEGDINSDGNLTLGENAAVTGNIGVGTVVVRGKVNGNITAREKIDLKSKAEVFGDIRASKLSMEDGVTFVGKTEVNPNKLAPSAQPPRSPEAPKIPDGAKLGGR
jgi:cytoskeletal protein CcmA (bactofilin family)